MSDATDPCAPYRELANELGVELVVEESVSGANTCTATKGERTLAVASEADVRWVGAATDEPADGGQS